MSSPVNASYKIDLAQALGETGEQEYARLMRVLLAAQGLFALVPVASDFPVEAREQLMQRLAQDLHTQGIALHIVSLNRERWDVLQALAEAAPSVGTPAVLAVTGLEETPGIVPEPGATPRRPLALALLNNTREGVRAQFPFPLLLWCAPSAFGALQEHAPDFYDHFIGLAEFLYAGPHLPLAEPRHVISDGQQDLMPTPTGIPGAQAAVAFYTDQVERHPEPSYARAQGLLGLAEALWGLSSADVQARLTQALEATEEALTFLADTERPDELARGKVIKGLILSDLPTVERARTLVSAIQSYEEALQLYTEQDFPEQWAMTQNNLGAAYQDLPTGDRAANLQKAIACYEAALKVRTEHDFPLSWAMTQNNLGIAYQNLPTGDRAANLQKAIACYEAALRVHTEQALPFDWAMTQNNLGTAYQNLPTGDRAANLQKAIVCYEAALRVYTEHAFPLEWARTQNNLGTAYQDLPTGDRAANLQKAIACYEAALKVRTEHDFPLDRAITQNNLGIAYQNLPTGDRAANLQKAIACYEAALRVYNEHDSPLNWAMTQNNLGNAYQELPTGDRTANVQHALTCFEAAVRGYEAVAMTEEVIQVKQRITAVKQQQSSETQGGEHES